MKAIKISEANGPTLDWLVGTLLGLADCDQIGTFWVANTNEPHFNQPFTPTTNWAQGGPLIEREGLHLRKSGCEWQCDYWNDSTMNFETRYGPTPLIAAMRCYVVSKLGDTAEVPEELL